MTRIFTPADIAPALDALAREVDQIGSGCPYELWIARACAASLRHADGLYDESRAAFLAAAAARGFFELDVSPGFLLEPTAETCAHGLPWRHAIERDEIYAKRTKEEHHAARAALSSRGWSLLAWGGGASADQM
jgi:hypothetical protein